MSLPQPADHPDFFRLPAPDGRSRESTLRLDARGRFWHEGRLVSAGAPPDSPATRLEAALHRWIDRHPDDGRFILQNGYDWTYFTVEDAPFFVRALRVEDDRVILVLSDGTEEAWEPEGSRVGAGGALYAVVKRAAKRGPYEAKFTAHAQSSLAPLLVEAPSVSRPAKQPPAAPDLGIGDDPEAPASAAGITVRIGGRARPIGAAAPALAPPRPATGAKTGGIG
jgi:hypothetical protein